MYIPFCSEPVNLTFNLIEIKVIRLMVGLIDSPVATRASNVAVGCWLNPTIGVIELGPGEFIWFACTNHSAIISNEKMNAILKRPSQV